MRTMKDSYPDLWWPTGHRDEDLIDTVLKQTELHNLSWTYMVYWV